MYLKSIKLYHNGETSMSGQGVMSFVVDPSLFNTLSISPLKSPNIPPENINAFGQKTPPVVSNSARGLNCRLNLYLNPSIKESKYTV